MRGNNKMKVQKKVTAAKFVSFWLPPFLWAFIIFSFSSMPTGTVSEIHWQDFVFKKFIHLVEYAVLTLLNYRAFLGSGLNKKYAMYASFFVSALYGMTDEFHQSFTPGREPKLRDIFIDTLGAGTATVWIVYFLPKSSDKIKKIAEFLNII